MISLKEAAWKEWDMREHRKASAIWKYHWTSLICQYSATYRTSVVFCANPGLMPQVRRTSYLSILFKMIWRKASMLKRDLKLSIDMLIFNLWLSVRSSGHMRRVPRRWSNSMIYILRGWYSRIQRMLVSMWQRPYRNLSISSIRDPWNSSNACLEFTCLDFVYPISSIYFAKPMWVCV